MGVTAWGHSADGSLDVSYPAIDSVRDAEAIFEWVRTHTTGGEDCVGTGPHAPYTEAMGFRFYPCGVNGPQLSLQDWLDRDDDDDSRWKQGIKRFDARHAVMYFDVVFADYNLDEDKSLFEDGELDNTYSFDLFNAYVKEAADTKHPDPTVLAMIRCETEAFKYIGREMDKAIAACKVSAYVASLIPAGDTFKYVYTPREWAARGELTVHDAVAYVTHDGPPLNEYLSDYCRGPEKQDFEWEIKKLGCYLQPVHGWSTAIVKE